MLKHKALMLYDQEDFPLAYFEKISEAVIFLGMGRDTINKAIYRNCAFRDGRKIMWVRL